MKVLIGENKVMEYVKNQYELDVINVERIKNSYKIICKADVYCLKAVEYDLGHFLFILAVINHIQRNNFKNTPQIIRQKNNLQYGILENKYVYLTKWIPSRLSNYDNPIELSMVAEKLGEFHECSKNFIIKKEMNPRIGWFSWINVFKTRVSEILDFKKCINQKYIKSDFDLLYLENINSQINMAYKSIEKLEKNNYYKLMEKEVFKGGFCHHDYAHHNILIDDENNLNIIDFDYCMLDSHLHDLGSLIIRCLKDGKWNEEKADMICNAYKKQFDLLNYEIPIIREFIRFPQGFWQIGLQNYWERQPWDEEFFMNKLQRYLDDFPERIMFIDNYFKGGN